MQVLKRIGISIALFMFTFLAVFCAQAQETVTIDMSVNNGTPSYVASGFLHGINNTTPPSNLVSPMKPRLFRFDDNVAGVGGGNYGISPTLYSRITGFGAVPMYMLGNAWIDNVGGFNPTNARVVHSADIAHWSTMCSTSASDAIGAGQSVQWDIWNEPDITDFWTGTEAEYQAAWKACVQAIRGVNAGQVIVGPSTCCSNSTGGGWIVDLLSYAQANNVLPNIVDWHEASFPPSQLSADVPAWKAYLALNYPSITKVAVSEYGQQSNYLIPGPVIQYMAAAERTQPFETSHTCWIGSVCETSNATLTEFLHTDETTINAIWYAAQGYANITGTMVGVTPSATVDGSAGSDCTVPQANSVFGRFGAASNVTFTYTHIPSCLTAGGQVYIQVSDVANDGGNGSSGPTLISAGPVTVSGGTASVTYALPSGDAAIIQLTPPVGGGPASDVYLSQNAQGLGNGASCANARAASYFNSSGNWGSGVSQIGPGTTAHLCGTITGSTGGTILTAQGSGTSGSPVTILFEAGAQLSAPYCNWAGNNSACLVISTPSTPRSYITVNGGTPCGWTWSGSAPACNGSIVNTASGTASNQGTSTGGIEMQNCTNCIVENLGIYNLYVQSGGDTNANPQGENCITYSGTNIFIHDNDMHDVGWCLYYSESNGDSNINVFNNEVYHTPHPMNFAGGGTETASLGYIYNNYWHDFGNWDTSACTYHVEGIHVSGFYPAVFNQLYFYNNKIGPNTGACLFADVYLSGYVNTRSAITAAVAGNVVTLTWPGGHTPAADGYVNGQPVGVTGFSGADVLFNRVYTSTTVNSTTITAPFTHANASSSTMGQAAGGGQVNNSAFFNNVLITDGAAGEYGIDFGAGVTNTAFNNTLLQLNATPGGAGGNFQATNFAAMQGNITSMNNAMQGGYSLVSGNESPFDGPYAKYDYNAYSQCPATGGSEEGNCLLAFGNPGSSWAGYIADAGSFGQEQHSHNTGLFGSGNCCTGSLGLNASYVPNAGSVVIGTGINLATLCTSFGIPGNPCLFDPNGNARGSVWNIGAMQGGGSGSVPSAPTGVIATVH